MCRWSLQWSHRLSAVETSLRTALVKAQRSPRPASMEPPPFGSGNLHHDPSTHDPKTISRRFNGATAFRQWKRGEVASTAGVAHGQASMEPPPFGSGNSIGSPIFSSPLLASMEPPPFGSGRHADVHGLHVAHHVASMEPPPFGSGNWLRLGTARCCPSRLQWSHRLSAVETPDSEVRPILQALLSWLQWSHRLSAVETRQMFMGLHTRLTTSSFNGATAFRQWKLQRCSVQTLLASSACFNGATAFRQWKPVH